MSRKFSLDELVKELQIINQSGFIPTICNGSTGVGDTLEDKLKIKRNNLAIADYGTFELKSSQSDSKSLITLFSKSPKLYSNITWKSLVKEYGYIDSKNRMALEITMQCNEKNNQGFYYKLFEDRIDIFCNAIPIAKYNKEVLEIPIKKNLANLVYVVADRKKINRTENFHYKKAYLLRDSTIKEFFECLQNNYITIDFRIHLKENGSVRDHGTAFRAFEKNLLFFYKTQEKLDITG